MIQLPAERPVLFFDGWCNLCSRAVQFVLRHDKKGIFLFASLQSVAGKAALEKLQAQQASVPDSLVLYYKGKYYLQSGAVLRIALLLGGVWKLAITGYIIPKFIRDIVYGWVARHRYQWFGKRGTCLVPDESLKHRFLEE